MHKCIYLPSSMDKNQYLPNYLNQNILFMVTPPLRIYFYINKILPGAPQCPTLHTWYSSWAFFCHSKTSWLQHFRGPWPCHTQILGSQVTPSNQYLNIFYQTGYVHRISSKNPYLPPDLGKAAIQYNMRLKTLIFVRLSYKTRHLYLYCIPHL